MNLFNKQSGFLNIIKDGESVSSTEIKFLWFFTFRKNSLGFKQLRFKIGNDKWFLVEINRTFIWTQLYLSFYKKWGTVIFYI